MQGQGGAKVEYMQSTAVGYRDNENGRTATITIDIGDVDERTAR